MDEKKAIRLSVSGNNLECEFDLAGDTAPEWSLLHETRAEGSATSVYTWHGFKAEVTVQRRVEGVDLISVGLSKNGAGFDLRQFKVTLRTPLRDMHRVWMPYMLLEGQLERVSLQWGFGYITSATRSMPFVECLDRRGENRASIGLVNQVTETLVRGSGFDQEARHVIEFSRPLEGITIKTRAYEEQVYLNTERRPWSEVLMDFTRLHDEVMGVKPAPRHPDVTQPLYCTWYAHGPEVTEEKILGELSLVRSLGFRNYVIDEGWFGHRPDGWMYRGDYTPDPEKFPDFRGLIRRIKEHGLNVLLWVSPFQVGPKSSRYPELRRYLIRREKLGELPSLMAVLSPWVQAVPADKDTEERWELCPRTGFTESYVPELVSGLVKDYGLDGLKIDFLDQVSPLPCRAEHEHVYQTQGEALWKTLKAMDVAIRRVKPNAIIEFRLPYANIVLRPFASLYRSQDCPWDFDQNRRLCSWINAFTPQPGPFAEADYISWVPEERPENVAKALASAILYCVPSIGRDFKKLPEVHVELVRRWLAFYEDHREEIRSGQWRPLEFDPHCSTFVIESGDVAFIGMFKDVPGRVRLPGGRAPKQLYLFNSTSESWVHTRIEPAAGEYELTVYDHLLEKNGEDQAKLVRDGLDLDVKVPEGGLLAAASRLER